MFTVTVPGTLANLGSGYDTLGLAVDRCNTFVVRPGPSTTPDLVARTAHRAGERFGAPCPSFEVEQHERIPRSRGMGSSATARVAGVLAWRTLTGCAVDERDLLRFLADEEGHPDNVWPALLGGLVVCGPVARRLPVDPRVAIARVSPGFPVETAAARALLPPTVAHPAAVANVSAVALLVAGLASADREALSHGVQDTLHQPWRASLLGPVDEAFAAARALGAAPFVSGSGSTLAAFVVDGRTQAVAEALAGPYREAGHEVQVAVESVRTAGATVRAG